MTELPYQCGRGNPINIIEYRGNLACTGKQYEFTPQFSITAPDCGFCQNLQLQHEIRAKIEAAQAEEIQRRQRV